MRVTIPATKQHEGIFSMTIDIADTCPQCGAKRGVKRWNGFSYDGSLRLVVSCWENECGHIDTYDNVRQEYFNSKPDLTPIS